MLRFTCGGINVGWNPETGELLTSEPPDTNQMAQIMETIHKAANLGIKEVGGQKDGVSIFLVDETTGKTLPHNHPDFQKVAADLGLDKDGHGQIKGILSEMLDRRRRSPLSAYLGELLDKGGAASRIANLLDSAPEPIRTMLYAGVSNMIADEIGDEIGDTEPLCLHFIRLNHYFRTEDGEVWKLVRADQGANVKNGEVRVFDDPHTKVTNLGEKLPEETTAPKELRFVDGMVLADYGTIEPGSWFSDRRHVYQRLHQDICRKHNLDGDVMGDTIYRGQKKDLLYLGTNAVRAWHLAEDGCETEATVS